MQVLENLFFGDLLDEIGLRNYVVLHSQSPAQKASVMYPGDEWAFLVSGLGLGGYVDIVLSLC
jgi:hypothetical protein